MIGRTKEEEQASHRPVLHITLSGAPHDLEPTYAAQKERNATLDRIISVAVCLPTSSRSLSVTVGSFLSRRRHLALRLSVLVVVVFVLGFVEERSDEMEDAVSHVR